MPSLCINSSRLQQWWCRDKSLAVKKVREKVLFHNRTKKQKKKKILWHSDNNLDQQKGGRGEILSSWQSETYSWHGSSGLNHNWARPCATSLLLLPPSNRPSLDVGTVITRVCWRSTACPLLFFQAPRRDWQKQPAYIAPIPTRCSASALHCVGSENTSLHFQSDGRKSRD